MDTDAATRPFRFFDNREKYLLFVTTCSEKWVIAERVGMELKYLSQCHQPCGYSTQVWATPPSSVRSCVSCITVSPPYRFSSSVKKSARKTCALAWRKWPTASTNTHKRCLWSPISSMVRPQGCFPDRPPCGPSSTGGTFPYRAPQPMNSIDRSRIYKPTARWLANHHERAHGQSSLRHALSTHPVSC